MRSSRLPTLLLLPLLTSCPSAVSQEPRGAVSPRPETFSSWTVTATPEKIERGRYLVQAVANCIVCHSPRAWGRYSGPLVDQEVGGGSDLAYLGLAEESPNITPTGLAAWSDSQIVQMLLKGKGAAGGAVHSFLPEGGYMAMALEDAYSVVAYLRTIPPLQTGTRPSTPNPGLAVDSPVDHPIAASPEPEDSVVLGRYLVRLAACRFCHGPGFRGGLEFRIGGRPPIETRNIADPSRGGVERESFVGRFRAFASDDSRRLNSPTNLSNTIMPWTHFGRMSEQDLGAIFDYLMSVRPKDAVSP